MSICLYSYMRACVYVCVARRVVSCISTGVWADQRKRANVFEVDKTQTVRSQVEIQTEERAGGGNSVETKWSSSAHVYWWMCVCLCVSLLGGLAGSLMRKTSFLTYTHTYTHKHIITFLYNKCGRASAMPIASHMPWPSSASATAIARLLAVRSVLLCALWGCVRTKEKMYVNKKRKKKKTRLHSWRACVLYLLLLSRPLCRIHPCMHVYVIICVCVSTCVRVYARCQPPCPLP